MKHPRLLYRNVWYLLFIGLMNPSAVVAQENLAKPAPLAPTLSPDSAPVLPEPTDKAVSDVPPPEPAAAGTTPELETAPEPTPAPHPAPSSPELEAQSRPEVILPTVPEVPLSRELQLMQEIEPGFIPKDERAIRLFMLQQAVADNDEAIKNKTAETQRFRALISQKFRADLNKYTESRTNILDERMQAATADLIKSYEEALKNHPHDPRYAPEALYNLGRYYFEVDEQQYFAKLAEYSEAREQGRDDIPYPEENFSRTIELYERLIKEFPNYPYLDSVYYLLALSLWYEGAFDNAVDYYETLIKKFPRSRYVEEVWFRLGEYFYDMDLYENAIEAYAHVLKNPQSSFYDQAVYKTAWSYFQKDEFQEAINYFIRVVELTNEEADTKAPSTTRAEAIRYIVKSFAEKMYLEEEKPRILSSQKTKRLTQAVGKTKEAASKQALTDAEQELTESVGVMLAERVIAYFEGLKRPSYFREILLELASQLLDEGKSTGAISALKHVIKINLRHRDNPRIESQIVDILQEAGKEDQARAANLALIKRYGKNSRWYKATAQDIKAQMNAREAVRDAMLALAVYFHKSGKAFKEAGDEEQARAQFKQAAAMYLAYVHDFPERDDTAKAIFYYAESVYELNRFKLALQAYQLLKDYPLPMADNIRRDATFNIVFTFRYVLENEVKRGRFKEIDFDALTSKMRGAEPEAIPQIGQQYLAAIDEFLRMAPQDPQVPVLLFHAAAIYYVYGHHQEAETRFFQIIDGYPQSTAAVVAARLIIDDAIAKENWPLVIELAKRFRDQDLGGQQKDFARIEGNARFKAARAIFEEANELKKNNQLALARAKYTQSAELFEKLLLEDPQNPFADLMLFNGARAIMQSGSAMAALPLFKKLYTTYPKSEFAKAARFQEALALERMLKFAEAAAAYDGIVKADPGSEAAADAMINKALLFEAAGMDNEAIAAFLAFAEKYPQRSEAPDALLSAAGIYKRQGKTTQQIASLEKFIKQYSKDRQKIPAIIEAHVQIADTYGDMAKASAVPEQKQRYYRAESEHYRAALALFSQDVASPIAAYYAAKAQLFFDKPEFDKFMRMKIDARTGKAQAEQLTAMMKKLTELSAKNEAIIKAFAQPVWNAKALYRIGSLYEHLARSILKAPCPRDIASIDEFACDEYIVLLEDKAAVLEDKALDAYKQAYDIGMSAYDSPVELIDDIQNGLNRLRPGKYQRVGQVIEKGEQGSLYGTSRMLSTGKMAATLHPDEQDPDIIKPEVPPTVQEVEKTPSTEQEPKEKNAPGEDSFDDLEEEFAE